MNEMLEPTHTFDGVPMIIAVGAEITFTVAEPVMRVLGAITKQLPL